MTTDTLHDPCPEVCACVSNSVFITKLLRLCHENAQSACSTLRNTVTLRMSRISCSAVSQASFSQALDARTPLSFVDRCRKGIYPPTPPFPNGDNTRFSISDPLRCVDVSVEASPEGMCSHFFCEHRDFLSLALPTDHVVSKSRLIK